MHNKAQSVFNHIYDAAQVKEQSFATVLSFLVVITDGQKKNQKCCETDEQLQLEARITAAIMVSCRKLAQGW